MSKEQAHISAVLAKYLSPPNVRVMLQQASRDGEASADGAKASTHEDLLVRLERGLALFLPETERDAAISELRNVLQDDRPAARTLSFDVRLESDISVVRTEARRTVELMGANGFAVQKVVTIVSELARNMVFYAGGGKMTLASFSNPHRGITINATDTGKGIPNIALVMSGNYRSRTGLGRGLIGCKRLADKFYLDSDKTGTRIEAEVRI